MNRRELQYFLAVVDYGSFARAAQGLAVKQPSVSEAIRNLERRLGAALFIRSSSGAKPTPLAFEILHEAREIDRRFRMIEHHAKGPSGPEAESLTLAIPAILAVHPGSDLIAPFIADHDHVNVKVLDQHSENSVWEHIETRKADLGIVTHISRPGFHSLFLGTHRLMAVFPPGFDEADGPVDLDELAQRKWISGPPLGFWSRRIIEELISSRGLTMNRLIQTDHRQMINHLVITGVGPAMANAVEARDLMALGAVVRPTTPIYERPYFLVHSAERRPSALVNSFLEHASAMVPQFEQAHTDALLSFGVSPNAI